VHIYDCNAGCICGLERQTSKKIDDEEAVWTDEHSPKDSRVAKNTIKRGDMFDLNQGIYLILSFQSQESMV
jgi:hypothetical protein